MKPIRIALLAVVVVAGLIYSLPWFAYAFILTRIDGRPEPTAHASLSPSDIEQLRDAYKLKGPAGVVPISPWDYVLAMALDGEKQLAAKGTVLAWPIARSYNSTHLDRRQWWHPAGAALTIWIMRSWTEEQVRAEALKIHREAEARRANPGLISAPPNNTFHSTSLPPRLRRSGRAAGERGRTSWKGP